MNRIDVGFLERFERVLESLTNDFVLPRPGPVLLESFAQSQLELARRFLGEGDRDNLGHGRAPRFEHAQNPVHELGRFTCAGRRFDHERVVEVFHDRTTGRLIVRRWKWDHAHRIDLNASRSAS